MTDTPPMADERVLYQTRDLQRFEKATAPVFIFGSTLGVLAVTDQRVLFLSTGGSGVGRALVGKLMGLLSPLVSSEISVALDQPGSLAIPHEALIDCSAQRRWDFGRYLRLTYEHDGTETHTSFIPRGVASSGWIEPFVDEVSRIVSERMDA